MRKHERELGEELDRLLVFFHCNNRPLPGVARHADRAAFIEQLVESIRRVKFVKLLPSAEISPARADFNDTRFDPLKAAVLKQRDGDLEEAFWLVFLSIHFGKHLSSGWSLCRAIYAGDGADGWTWEIVRNDVSGFRNWLDANGRRLKDEDDQRAFGNHRRYESLDAHSSVGTGEVVETYVQWADPSHENVFSAAIRDSYGDSEGAFDDLFRSMKAVARFGRLARFDYLAMVEKLRLADIKAGSPYLQGATGPMRGARLIFGDVESRIRPSVLNEWVSELAISLGVGMQEIEDSLCNWQKSPSEFIAFRG